MGLARSTFYDAPAPAARCSLLGLIGAICDEFECYGYRRVGAALRHQGVVVNSKKLRRLMREHGFSPSGADDIPSPRTAITMGRSSPTWRRTWFPFSRTRCGWRT